MTPDDIPQELLDIVERAAGRPFPAWLLPCLAEVLTAHSRMLSGHELSRAQIAKHGKDRYPTAGAQYSKVLDEAGELGEALIAFAGGAFSLTEAEDLSLAVGKELADVGLALYALGDKLGLDLIDAMRDLVSQDSRTFA